MMHIDALNQTLWPRRLWAAIQWVLLPLPLLFMFACAASHKKTGRAEEPTVAGDTRPRSGPSSYTVRGQRYYVLASAAGYDETGLAAWYGGRFHGRKTANGERFDAKKLTAAHRTLPFGTRVEVTNQKNGRKVTVRINDRGPFSKSHIIDLSRAAAEAIGLKHSGMVRIVAVNGQ